MRSFLHELSTSWGYSFPRRNVWKVKVALGVSVFFFLLFLCVCVWTIARGKILTLDNLRNIGVLVVERCCM